MTLMCYTSLFMYIRTESSTLAAMKVTGIIVELALVLDGMDQ